MQLSINASLVQRIGFTLKILRHFLKRFFDSLEVFQKRHKSDEKFFRVSGVYSQVRYPFLNDNFIDMCLIRRNST